MTGSCQNSGRLEAKSRWIKTSGVIEYSGILSSEGSDSPVYSFDKANGNPRAVGQRGNCGSSQPPHAPGFLLQGGSRDFDGR